MTAVLLLGVFGSGVVGGWLGCHRLHRARIADAEHKADMWEYMRDVAENRVAELAYAEQHLIRLRNTLIRPRKRRIPGDTQ